MIYQTARLVEVLTVPALVMMVVLALLTMRSIIKRDQAMMFGKTAESEFEARRLSYERTWRNNRLTNA